MKLTDIDLRGYGRFLKGKACFEVKKYFLPEEWDYIYTNRRILVRIRHDGTGYVQIDPPGGTVLYKTERFQEYPSFFVWLKPEGSQAFSNFYKPNFLFGNRDSIHTSHSANTLHVIGRKSSSRGTTATMEECEKLQA